MNLRDLSVSTRLILAFGAVIAVFGVALTLSIVRLGSFSDSASIVTGPELTKLQTVTAWQFNIDDSMRRTRNMLIFDDKAKIQEEIEVVKNTFDKRKEYADALTASLSSPEAKALLQTIFEARAINTPLEHEFLEQVEAGQIKDARQMLLQRVRPAQLALLEGLTKLSDYQKAQIKAQARVLAASYQSSRTLLLMLALAAVAVASALAFVIARAIKSPLYQALAVLAQIEKGNYNTAVTVSSRDETGKVLSALDAMQRSLKERIERDRAAAMENGRAPHGTRPRFGRRDAGRPGR